MTDTSTSITMGSHTVTVGQTWLDLDKRRDGRRTVIVREIAPHPTRGQVAVCNVAMDGNLTGSWTRIAVERLRPTHNGYRLVNYPGLKAGASAPEIR